MSLSAMPDIFLGSEKGLTATLGVSRSTLSQADNLVQQEHLLSVVRGARGSVFSRRRESVG